MLQQGRKVKHENIKKTRKDKNILGKKNENNGKTSPTTCVVVIRFFDLARRVCPDERQKKREVKTEVSEGEEGEGCGGKDQHRPKQQHPPNKEKVVPPLYFTSHYFIEFQIIVFEKVKNKIDNSKEAQSMVK